MYLLKKISLICSVCMMDKLPADNLIIGFRVQRYTFLMKKQIK